MPRVSKAQLLKNIEEANINIANFKAQETELKKALKEAKEANDLAKIDEIDAQLKQIKKDTSTAKKIVDEANESLAKQAAQLERARKAKEEKLIEAAELAKKAEAENLAKKEEEAKEEKYNNLKTTVLKGIQGTTITSSFSIKQFGDDAEILYSDLDFMREAVKVVPKMMIFAEDDIALQLLKEDGKLMKNANERVKSSTKHAFAAVRSFPEAIFECAPEIQKNDEVVLESIKTDWKMLGQVNKRYRTFKPTADAALEGSYEAKKYISKTLIENNRSTAVRLLNDPENKRTLKDYSNGLRRDEIFVTDMILKEPKNIKHSLIKDLEIQTKLAQSAFETTKSRLADKYLNKENPLSEKEFKKIQAKALYKLYKTLPKAVQQDDYFAIQIVSNNGLYLNKLKGKVATYQDVKFAALKENGLAIKFIKSYSKESYKKYALAAVEQNGAAFYDLPKWLQKDKDVVKVAVANYSRDNVKMLFRSKLYDATLGKLPFMKKDREFYRHPLTLKGMKKYKKDSDVMLDSIKANARSLKLGANAIKNNTDAVSVAVNIDGTAIEFASKKQRKEPQNIADALKNNLKAKELVDAKFFKDENNLTHILDVLTVQPKLYYDLPKALQKNEDVILITSPSIPEAAKNLSLELKQDPEYMRKLYQSSREAFKVADPLKLTDDEKFMKEMKEWEASAITKKPEVDKAVKPTVASEAKVDLGTEVAMK